MKLTSYEYDALFLPTTFSFFPTAFSSSFNFILEYNESNMKSSFWIEVSRQTGQKLGISWDD